MHQLGISGRAKYGLYALFSSRRARAIPLVVVESYISTSPRPLGFLG